MRRTIITEEQLLGQSRQLAAMLWMSRKGWSISPTLCGSAPYDFAATKGSTTYRCEVKGERKSPRGNAPIGALCKQRDCTKFDLFLPVDDNFNVRCVRSAMCLCTEETLRLTGIETEHPHTRKGYRKLEGQC